MGVFEGGEHGAEVLFGFLAGKITMFSNGIAGTTGTAGTIAATYAHSTRVSAGLGGLARPRFQSLTLEALEASQGHASQPPGPRPGRASQGQPPHRPRRPRRAIRKPTEWGSAAGLYRLSKASIAYGRTRYREKLTHD